MKRFGVVLKRTVVVLYCYLIPVPLLLLAFLMHLLAAAALLSLDADSFRELCELHRLSEILTLDGPRWIAEGFSA